MQAENPEQQAEHIEQQGEMQLHLEESAVNPNSLNVAHIFVAPFATYDLEFAEQVVMAGPCSDEDYQDA